MSNIYQSKYKGQELDQAVNDTASLKTRMEEAEGNIQYLNTHKANINIVPKSIKDLEPNASLVYVGTEEPSINCDIWFYPKDETEYIIKVRNNGGVWVDVASGSGISPTITITESTQGYTLVITDVTGSKTIEIRNGNDGYTPQKGVDYWTDTDKAEIKSEVSTFVVNVTIGEDGTVTADKNGLEIVQAYNDGRNIIAVAGHAVCSLTMIIPASNEVWFTNINREVQMTLWCMGDSWGYSTNSLAYTYQTDALNTQITNNSNRITTLETNMGNVETALDNIIAIQNNLMGVSE